MEFLLQDTSYGTKEANSTESSQDSCYKVEISQEEMELVVKAYTDKSSRTKISTLNTLLDVFQWLTQEKTLMEANSS